MNPGHFSRFLKADRKRLHFAAHSHHPWPDASFEAHQQAWLDAAVLADRKWERCLGEVLPAIQRHLAALLSLPDPATITFAPNTHEFFKRVLSCLPDDRPIHVLATDSEFHSFERQSRRLEEAGRLVVERVPVEPFDSFLPRLRDASHRRRPDLVYVSQVFYNSGWIFPALEDFVAGLHPETWVMIDGYHAFGAMPVDLSRLASRAFWVAGGYKYGMSGEGACFLHCPPGWGERPVDTGWYAGFGALEGGVTDVAYAQDGARFFGSTFDPSGLYRMRAVLDLWKETGTTPADFHAHARRLQDAFLERLDKWKLDALPRAALLPGEEWSDRGNFLTFRLENAGDVCSALLDANVVVDYRGDRLRFGFGVYQTEDDLDRLGRRLRKLFR